MSRGKVFTFSVHLIKFMLALYTAPHTLHKKMWPSRESSNPFNHGCHTISCFCPSAYPFPAHFALKIHFYSVLRNLPCDFCSIYSSQSVTTSRLFPHFTISAPTLSRSICLRLDLVELSASPVYAARK